MVDANFGENNSNVGNPAAEFKLVAIQYRPDLVDLCLAATELIPDG